MKQKDVFIVQSADGIWQETGVQRAATLITILEQSLVQNPARLNMV